MLTLDKVYKASHVLKEVIRETDLIKAPKINKEAEVYLKTENLQVTGSFKVRGAYNKIMKRTSHEAPKKTSTTLEVGQTIKVVSGPLAEFDGVISEVAPESGKVKVMVSIFGRETPVELSFDQVARI